MREHDLQAPHRVGLAHGPKAHDGTITTEVPDVMWGTDMTATMTVGEGAAVVFVAVDHCTTECIGLHAAKSGPHAEGECLVGAELRHDRGAPPGLARVQADIQRTLDTGEVRLPKPRSGTTRPRRAGRGSVEANTVKPLSKNPGAIHPVQVLVGRILPVRALDFRPLMSPPVS